MTQLKWQDLLQGRLTQHTTTPPARRVTAELLFPMAISNLARRSIEPHEANAFFAQWDALVRQRRGATSNQWPEITAAMSSVLLLLRELCSLTTAQEDKCKQIESYLRENIDERMLVSQQLSSEQQFILLVEDVGRVERLVTAFEPTLPSISLDCIPAQIEQQPWLHWWLKTENIRGRSHSLMLGLKCLEHMNLLNMPEVAFAATGELKPSGEIESIDHLLIKQKAWFERFPQGLLLTPPPKQGDWLSAHQSYQAQSSRCGEKPKSGNLHYLAEGQSKNWLSAASLQEATEKIKRWQHFQEEPPLLRNWDGTELPEAQYIPVKLGEHRGEGLDTLTDGPFEREEHLLHSLWEMTYPRPDKRPAPQGIAIYGQPGSGKSILAKSLENSFTTGSLGAFGTALYRKARELVQSYKSTHDKPDLALLLSQDIEQRSFLRRMLEQSRLILIIDGLDEIDAQAFQLLTKLLQETKVRFIATSRMTLHAPNLLPRHVSLEIKDVSAEQAHQYLLHQNRHDLVEQLIETNPYQVTWRTKEHRHPAVSLQQTPFGLFLLCKVTPLQEMLVETEPSSLYHNMFQCMLERAVLEGRMSQEEKDFLRQTIHEVIGLLAIEWLSSNRSTLPRSKLIAELQAIGLNHAQQLSYHKALEAGHLIVPGADELEFAHRTIAEWAAAKALHQKVETLFAKDRDRVLFDDLKPHSVKSQLESNCTKIFFEDSTPIDQSMWRQTLLFYTSMTETPGAFVRRVVEHSMTKSQQWVEQGLSFAMEVANRCKWTRQTHAREIWSFFVRVSLFAPREIHTWHNHKTLRPFLSQVGPFLPTELSELIALAAQNQAQKQQLEDDPFLLLPWTTDTQQGIWNSLFLSAGIKQKSDVLRWTEEHHVKFDSVFLHDLLDDIPLQIKKTSIELEQIKQLLEQQLFSHEVHPTLQEMRDLHELDNCVWRVCLRQETLPSWKYISRTLQEWPSHLDRELKELMLQISAGTFNDAFRILFKNYLKARCQLKKTLQPYADKGDPHSLLPGAHRDLFEDEHFDARKWLSAVARTMGLSVNYSYGLPKPSFETSNVEYMSYESKKDALVPILRDARGLAKVAGRLAFLFERLSKQNVLEEKIRPHWDLVSDIQEQYAMFEIFLEKRLLPPWLTIKEILFLYEEPGGQGALQRVPMEIDGRERLTEEQQQQWYELVEIGTVNERVLAAQWILRNDKDRTPELLDLLSQDSAPEIRELVEQERQIVKIPEHALPDIVPTISRRWGLELEETEETAELSPVEECVEECFQKIEGDVHQLYTTPGALGSDYDEPGDLDIHSSQTNQSIVRKFERRISRRLSQHPEEYPALRRLLTHPSDSLRVFAFRNMANRTEPSQFSSLALEAITGHIENSQTRTEHSGQSLAALYLPRHSGENHVDIPNVAGELIKAIRDHLPPMPSDFLGQLATHSHPAIRGNAIQWMRELCCWEFPIGLNDPDPLVLSEALHSWESNASIPPNASELLEHSKIKWVDWSLRHHNRFLFWLLYEYQVSLFRKELCKRESPLIDRGAIWVEYFNSVIESLRSTESTEQFHHGLVRGLELSLRYFLSQESLDGGCGESLISHDFMQGALFTKEPLRSALFRVIADKKPCFLQPKVEQLLSSVHTADRVLAAECLMLWGDVRHRQAILNIWDDSLHSFESYDEMQKRRQQGVDRQQVKARFIRALEFAASPYPSLLPFLLHFISNEMDRSEYLMSEQGERWRALGKTLLLRWGRDAGQVLVDALSEEHYRADEAEEILRQAENHKAIYLDALKQTASKSRKANELYQYLERKSPGELKDFVLGCLS